MARTRKKRNNKKRRGLSDQLSRHQRERLIDQIILVSGKTGEAGISAETAISLASASDGDDIAEAVQNLKRYEMIEEDDTGTSGVSSLRFTKNGKLLSRTPLWGERLKARAKSLQGQIEDGNSQIAIIEDKAASLRRLGEKRDVTVTTQTLNHLCATAKKNGYANHAIDSSDGQDHDFEIDPAALHNVKAVALDGDVLTCDVQVKLSKRNVISKPGLGADILVNSTEQAMIDSGIKHPSLFMEHKLDISLKDFDLLLAPNRTKPKQGGISGDIIIPMPTQRVRWAGSRSYDRAFEFNDYLNRCVESFTASGGFEGKNVRFDTPEGPLYGGECEILVKSTRAVHAARIIKPLTEAQVVIVDPEEAEAIIHHKDALTLEQAWDWANDAILPFNPLYIDLEAPGGRPTVVKHVINGEPVEIGMRGVVFYRGADDNLLVTPIGGDGFLRDYAQPPELKSSAIFGNELYESYGAAVIGNGSNASTAMSSTEGFFQVGSSVTPFWTSGINSLTAGGDRNGVVLHTQTKHYAGLEVPEEHRPHLNGLSIAIAAQVTAAMNVLFFLNTSNIELVDAPVEKRVLKRADKRGWDVNVSQIIAIHHNRKRNINYTPPEPGSSGLQHSHCYKVAAHVRHLQAHTREYQNRPDLVTPCPVHGSCRKIGVRTHFRGLNNPYVEKTRILKDQPS